MDILTFVLVAIFSMIFGALVAALIFSLRGGGKTQKADPKVKEIVRLLHDQHSGHMMVEVGGKRWHARSELNDREQRLLLLAANELRAWLGVPVPQPQPAPQPAEQPSTSLPPITLPPPAEIPAQPAVKPVPVDPLAAYGKIRTSSAPAAPVIKSITGQIDDILQEKLAGTPLAERKIRLTDSPAQGVVVEVGADKYTGVDEVPDEEVRTVIHQAVAEWERRNKM